MSEFLDQPDDALAALVARLTATAEPLDLPLRNADDLVGTAFRGGTGSAVATIKPSDLPTASRGLQIGRYTLILGVLPETPSINAMRECVRRYRNQCVIARSYLSPNAALDLLLILVGPAGSETSTQWQSAALMVERDDRVARKLVWLRPVNASLDNASFADFASRTFLARPWHRAKHVDPAQLDQLNDAETSSDALPRTTAQAWEAAALREDEDPERTVTELVAAWAQRGAA
jgi:hypothetical protein